MMHVSTFLLGAQRQANKRFLITCVMRIQSIVFQKGNIYFEMENFCDSTAA
jgi:hypothetical protein